MTGAFELRPATSSRHDDPRARHAHISDEHDKRQEHDGRDQLKLSECALAIEGGLVVASLAEIAGCALDEARNRSNCTDVASPFDPLWPWPEIVNT
ncbi:MAG: hypothetical protein AAF458_17820 [Pseudomonadota bacterium]